MTELNEMIVDENDLVEGLLQGKSARYIITKDTEKIDSYNHFCTLFKFNDQIDYETPADSSDKYTYEDVDNWHMPEEYKQLDVKDYIEIIMKIKNDFTNSDKTNEIIKSVNVFDLYEGENIDEDKKSVALKVLFEPTDKTLNDKEIDELSDKIILAAKSLGGSLRSQ